MPYGPYLVIRIVALIANINRREIRKGRRTSERGEESYLSHEEENARYIKDNARKVAGFSWQLFSLLSSLCHKRLQRDPFGAMKRNGLIGRSPRGPPHVGLSEVFSEGVSQLSNDAAST